MKKLLRVVAAVTLTLILLSASLLAVVPTLSVGFVDFSHPTQVQWEQKDDGSKEAKAHFEVMPNHTMPRFYEAVHSPVRPNIWQIIPICFGLGLVYLLGIDLLTTNKKWFERGMLFAGAVQVLLVFMCIGVAIALYKHLEPTAALQAIVSDQDLVKEVASNASKMLGDNIMLAILLPMFTFIFADVILLASVVAVEGGSKAVGKYLWGKARKLVGLDISDRTYLDFHQGTVRLLRFPAAFRWFPIPRMAVRRETIRSISFRDFFTELTKYSKQAAFRILRERLLAMHRTKFRGTGAAAASSLVETVSGQLHTKVTASLTALREGGEGSEPFENATGLLQRTSDTTLKRFQQDLLVGVTTVIEEVLGSARRHILRRISDRAFGTQEILHTDGQLLVYPANTRFFLTRGAEAVFVIEQKPQVRTVLFSDGFMKHYAGGSAGWRKRVEKVGDSYGLQLAFPYVLFAISFQEGQFNGLWVQYSNRPIRSLDETLYAPNLPNTTEDGSVCLRFGGCRETTLPAKAEEVISYFWQSAFNTDWPHNYSNTAKRDTRLASAFSWQENSRANPLFVLEVDWLRPHYTLRELLLPALEKDEKKIEALLGNQVRAALDEGIEQVVGAVRAYCKGIVVRDHYPRTVVKSLEEHLQSLKTRLLEACDTGFADTAADTDRKLLSAIDRVVADTFNRVLADDFGEAEREVTLTPEISTEELLSALSRGGT